MCNKVKSMNILHLSDIHFRNQYEKAETGYLSALYQMTSPLVHLKKCFEQIDRSKLDAVAISGDLTEAGMQQDYRDLKVFLEKALGDIPLIVTLGNHDNKLAFREGWGLTTGDVSDPDAPYNAVLDVDDVRILSLDNAISGYADGIIIPEQFLWLKNALSDAVGRKVVLVLHHPLLANQADIPSASWEPDFYELIKNSGILGILCGHTHHSYFGSFADVPNTTAPSMSFRAKRGPGTYLEFEEYPGYQVCNFSDMGMAVNTVYLYHQPRFLKYVELDTFMSS